MIIDFHVHCFPDELALRAVSSLAERSGINPRLDGTVEDIRKSMEISGVGKSVVLPIATKPTQTEKINEWAFNIQGGGVIAFGSVHPYYTGWEKELKRIKEMGLKGVKFHPDYQQFFVDEKKMFPIYELAFELGLIVVFHAGVDLGFRPPFHCTPEKLSKVVKAFPGGKIVAAHMGGYKYWNDVEKYLVGMEIFFDTSYSLGCIGWHQAERIIRTHGYNKILFATDSPWKSQAEEIEKVRRLNLGEGEIDAILGGNAEALLTA
ncbi:MAG: amidohydrolase family protein [Acetivibrionales bacterium]|jgi:predicted TIM-barrel fold metal-dependent hydrolase